MKMSEAYYLRVVFFFVAAVWDLSGPVIINCCDMTGGLCGKLALWGLRGFLPASASLQRSEWRFVLTHLLWKGHDISICCIPALAWRNDSFAISVYVCVWEKGLKCGSLVAATVTQSIMTDKLIACKEKNVWLYLLAVKPKARTDIFEGKLQCCTADLEGATQVVLCHTHVYCGCNGMADWDMLFWTVFQSLYFPTKMFCFSLWIFDK